MTKGGKCCLNCLIMRQTNICPTVLRTPMISMCKTKTLCQKRNSKMSTISSRMHEYRKEMMETHLLISVIIYMGSGLYQDLISAWKSGKKPSANRDTMSRIMPMISVCFSSLLLDSGSNTLNMMIPIVMMTPTTIFFVPNFNFLSLTLEQSTPTSMTEMRLQDLNIMTTGQLVRQMAQVQVRVEMATVIAQTADFLLGIQVLSSGLIWKWLTMAPMIQVAPQGKIRNPDGQVKFSSRQVKSLVYLLFNMASWMSPVTRQLKQIPSTPDRSCQHRLGSTQLDNCIIVDYILKGSKVRLIIAVGNEQSRFVGLF